MAANILTFTRSQLSSNVALLTIVAVMKKFHGKRVPKPRMKKMIHTNLYLGKRQRDVNMIEVNSLFTGSHPNLSLAHTVTKTETESSLLTLKGLYES